MLKLDEKARPSSIPNGAESPIWTVLGPCQMGFLASFGKAPGFARGGAHRARIQELQRGTGRRRRRIPQPNRPEGHTDGVSAVRGPHPRTTPPAPAESGCRERKGALLSEGPLGDLEAKPGFEPGVKALQASALPLGHFAEKGPPKRSGNAMERTTGLEPATPTLARLCSTN